MKKLLPLVIVFAVIAACQPRQVYKKMNFSGMAQGTYYAVTYYDHLDRNFQPQVDSLLDAFDMSVSMWVPESVISRINRGGNPGEVMLDNTFIETYKLARKIAEQSNGAFDYTIGPLVNAWGFGFEDRQRVDQAMVDSLLPLVNYHYVTLVGDRILLEKPGIQFDFNAVAQGYSVDLVGDFLASKGIRNYLVDIGGEVLAVGEKPREGKWKIGIEKPSEDELSERKLQTMLELKNKAMATSGSYRKFYEEDGIRYSHTIDPATGFPVQHTLLSVSVIADDCGTADAWATAFMVMGVESAKEILAGHKELEAYFIFSNEDGSLGTYFTEGIKEMIR
jgi:thiamine biosynthesis lipoprotein